MKGNRESKIFEDFLTPANNLDDDLCDLGSQLFGIIKIEIRRCLFIQRFMLECVSPHPAEGRGPLDGECQVLHHGRVGGEDQDNSSYHS